MGFIDFEVEPFHKEKIKKALLKRGLKPDYEGEWEIHGPHESMNYQIYVGLAYEDNPDDGFWVAIYPWGVWLIEESSDWYKRDKESRIVIEKG